MSDLIKELRDLAASEELADRAADELERLIALDSESKLALDKFNKQLMTENGALRKELAALKAPSTEPVANIEVTEIGISYGCLKDLPVGTYFLYTTPPTATALVEDFKRRAVEVCRKNWWEFGKYIVEEIESLPVEQTK